MDVHVARQPILLRDQRLFGYELLFRGGATNAFPGIDGDTATSSVLTDSFLTIGMDRLAGNKPVFINFTRELLLKKIPTLFPPKKLVVEILEDLQPDPDLIDACRQITAAGYQMVLDDFVYRPELEPFMALASIIKIDVRISEMLQIKEIIKKTAFSKIRLLAEKVETHDEYRRLRELGFWFFQGYFFARPEIVSGRQIGASKMNLLQIIAEVNGGDVKMARLEKLIHWDVNISYKLLRYLNSAFFRRAQAVSSIKKALLMLGETGVRQFVTLIAAAELAAGKPGELIRTCIVRAKFCELLADGLPGIYDRSELFLLGLFSLIDAILDMPMDQVMGQLPLSGNITEALVHGQGRLAPLIGLTRCYESGDWTGIGKGAAALGLEESRLPAFYQEALGWADAFPDI
jgi:EAL and modified HD-GYP domain-containing signal transduction protein